MKKTLWRFLLAILILTLLCGCTNTKPKLDPGVTPPPALPTGEPVSEVPTATVQPARTAEPTPAVNTDALGNIIYTSDHFERYISFKNILVYEENGETLIDCTVNNSYPNVLLCAVNVEFFSDSGEKLANGSLQMPDGSFLLALKSGENRLYARILTDTVLTDKRFEFVFDPQTGVKPE